MYRRYLCTFIGSTIKKTMYLGQEREFIELSFINHYGENNREMSALKVFTTTNKLKKALEYRKMQALTINKRYYVYMSDYKGNKKLTFSGIKEVDN